jgi:PAS domain S-box-containing protein
LLSDLPHLFGVMIVGYDSSRRPIAYGTNKLFLNAEGAPFFFLEDIELRMSDEVSWFPFPESGVGISMERAEKARILNDNGERVGLIVVQIKSPSAAQASLGVIDDALRYLIWAIRDGIRIESTRISQETHTLTLGALAQSEVTRPQLIAEHAQSIFRGDIVTILMREDNEFRLFATTDIKLKNRHAGTYALGDKLSEYVFKTGRTLRLRNSRSGEAVCEQLDRDLELRFQTEYPEWLLRSDEPFRLLIVPVFLGREQSDLQVSRELTHGDNPGPYEDNLNVKGVVHILRRNYAAPFSAAELEGLQKLADFCALATQAQEVAGTKENQHLGALLEKKGLAYYRADLEDQTMETSTAECQLTGYEPKELLKMSRRMLYRDFGDRYKLIERVRKADGKLVEYRERLKRRDGTLFWAEGVTHLLKDSSGSEIGYEGLYEDVTDRLRLQGFLELESDNILEERELYNKLKQNVRLQLLFVTSLGHQLRSPLGALVEELKNLRRRITDPRHFSDRLKYSIGQAGVCAQMVANLTYLEYDFER